MKTVKPIEGETAALLTAVLDAYTRAMGARLPRHRRIALGERIERTAAQPAASRANGARGGRPQTR